MKNDEMKAFLDDWEAQKAPAKEEPMLLPEAPIPNLDVRGGKGFVPEKRTYAVLTGEGAPGYPMLAEDLKKAKDDTSRQKAAALAGGFLEAATLGHGDEAAAALGALRGEGDYSKLRDENRGAFEQAQEWDPKLNLTGKVAGSVLSSLATPSLAPNVAKSMFSGANLGKAALTGGIAGLGESKADLTKGDVGGAAWDTVTGAGLATAAHSALGLVGKGAKYVGSLPERAAARADNELIDKATLGATATQRDALSGDLGVDKAEMLRLIRSHPALERTILEGDTATATKIVRELRQKAATAREATVSEAGEKWGEMDVRTAAAKIEKVRDELAASPAIADQKQAAWLDKQLQSIKDKWIPAEAPPTPKGGELLGKLVEKANKFDKDRVAHNADDTINVVKKYKIDKEAADPVRVSAKSGETIDDLGKVADTIYKAADKKPIFLANVKGDLYEFADELSKTETGLVHAPNVRKLADLIMEARSRGGDRTSITSREMREIITAAQNEAFTGSYSDPKVAQEIGRKVAGRLKDFLDQHVTKVAGKAAAKKLAQTNREISLLVPIKISADEQVAAARLLPDIVPDARTGTATVQQFQNLIDKTEDPEVKRLLTGELYRQLDKPLSRRLAWLDREQEFLGRLEEPLAHKAARESSAPTTLRSHGGAVRNDLSAAAATGGALAVATGHGSLGFPAIMAALAAKYGRPAVAELEKKGGAIVAAARRGMDVPGLRLLAKQAKLRGQEVEDFIDMVAPRATAGARGNDGSDSDE